MKNEKIPTSIKSPSGEVGFGQINHDFSETEHGRKLASNIRYDRYKPNNITNTEWEKLLGVDVNNLKHLQLTYGLARQFIKYSNNLSTNSGETAPDKLKKEEQENLLLAAIIHDWAEAVVGDISYDLKTSKEEDVEFIELKKND